MSKENKIERFLLRKFSQRLPLLISVSNLYLLASCLNCLIHLELNKENKLRNPVEFVGLK
jgi:hypothetical protein